MNGPWPLTHARPHPGPLPREREEAPAATAAAIAVVSRRVERGEVLYSARVRVNGYRSLCLDDEPSAQSVCLEVLEWAQRHGRSGMGARFSGGITI
jgi:hypothetical protein